ncbi:unnamed protein product [Sphagnum troendelagicum]|uniref:Uncharacterized protein n=1 Tax=Sphagnum troendelagicum TaxID=128251 RepID=A0ABP0T7Y4_9BRYO
MEQWRKYLFQEHNVIAVSPLKTLNLLDVLIKTDHEGFTPVLEKVGSMVNLGKQGQEFDETREYLRRGLESFQRTRGGAQGDEELFTWKKHPEIYVTLKSSTSVTSSLLILFGDADLQFHKAKHLQCDLKRVFAAGVDKEELTELMTEKKWKPDIDKAILKWPQPHCLGGRGRKLWVITEILYAEKLSVASADSNSLGGGANTSGPALEPVGVPGPVGGKIKASTTLDNGLDFIAQDNNPFMFAYGAICAEFDSTGDYDIHKLNAGKHPPKTRSAESGGNSSSQMHLEGLFLNPPTGDQQDDEDLQCLEIVDAVE